MCEETRKAQPTRDSKGELTPQQIEDRRQIEHVAWLFVAFLLPYISRLVLLLIGAVGLVYALVISPKVIRVTTRPQELKRLSRAKLSYALSSLTALLIFFDRIYIGAGAFAMLAVGDALSNLVGRKFGGPRFPYNPRKTLAGSFGLWLGGALAAWAVILWNRPQSGFAPWRWLVFCLITGFFCAAVESLPQIIDDNITIVWVGASAFYVLFSLPSFAPELQVPLLTAVAVNSALAFAAVALAWLTVGAAGLALCLGTVSLLSVGWPGYMAGVGFVVIASICTRLGRARKRSRGLAELPQGRNVYSVAGKGTVPLVLALAYAFGRPGYLAVAYVAAFASAAFDTVATEIGQWLSPTARSPLTWRLLPAGSPGGISWQGTAAGAAAAVLIGAIPPAFGWLPLECIPVVLGAAFIGSYFESLLKTGGAEKTEPASSVFNLYTTMAGACAGAGAWLIFGG